MVKSCWEPLVFAPNCLASNMKVGSNRVRKVSKSASKTLHHDLFNDVLSSRGNIRKIVTQIQSQQHQLLVTQINKIVMTAFDKRFILEDGIQSFACGHYSLKQTNTFCIVLFGSTEFSLEHYRLLSFNIV